MKTGMRRRSASVLAAALILSALGCEAPGRSGEEPRAPAEALVWPSPPAEARIRYVRSFSGPRDLGIEKSFFGRLLAAVAGKAEERLVQPSGVAERDGVIYVADPGAQAVWIFDPVNQRAIKVNELDGTELVSPVAVADRPDGSVFVADSFLKMVFLIDRQGRLVRVVAGGGLQRPAALAYDETADRLYVADSAGQRIAVYSSAGREVLSWGRRGANDGEFNYPAFLALDASSEVLVTDALNYRIQAFDRAGRFLWKMGRHGDGSGDFAAPKGVAADNEGHIYVVDALFDSVQTFGHGGTLLLAFGGRGTGFGEFWLPAGLFINKQDRVYVADPYNQRIQVFEVLPGSESPLAEATRHQ